MDQRKIVLGLDYNNLLIGSYFGKELINSRGENVNAVKGFFMRLNSICNYIQPDLVVVAQDLGRSDTFRRKMYAPYKGTRKPSQGNLGTQLRYGIQLLAHCGFPIVSSSIYEADDILGMVGTFGTERDWQVVIASSDRDYYQLITDNVSVFSPRLKRLIDRGWIMERYGLEPRQLLEVKALAGDQSDNIPGARGIGEKIAIDLIRRYGDVANLFSHLDELHPKLKHILLSNAENVKLSWELGRIVTDYQLIMLTEKDLNVQPSRNPKELMETIAYLELHSLVPMMQYAILPFTAPRSMTGS